MVSIQDKWTNIFVHSVLTPSFSYFYLKLGQAVNKKATGKGGFQSLQSCGLVKSSFFGDRD
jgi:hypothetical protein